jgi:hypothetical protein
MKNIESAYSERVWRARSGRAGAKEVQQSRATSMVSAACRWHLVRQTSRWTLTGVSTNYRPGHCEEHLSSPQSENGSWSRLTAVSQQLSV